MTLSPPPKVDPRELRPSRVWYGVAVAVVLLGVALGAVVVVLSAQSTASSIPEIEQEFTGGETAQVRLQADEPDWAIYVLEPDSVAAQDCTVTSPEGDPIALRDPSGSFTFGNGEQNWKLAATFTPNEGGDYVIECDADTGTTLGAAEAIDTGGLVGGTFGILGGVFGGVCLPGVVAGVIVLVVAMKRSGHAKRLRRERSTSHWG